MARLVLFTDLHVGKAWPDRVKPSTILLVRYVRRFKHPVHVDPSRVQPVAPDEANPRRWLLCNWFNVYISGAYRITTRMPSGEPGTVGVKGLGTIASASPFHPETKRCDEDGAPCGRCTSGVLKT